MMGIFKSLSFLTLVVLLSVGHIRGAPDTKVNLLPSDCGTSETIDGTMRFDNEPRAADYPWMAILRYNTSRGFQDSCIGSLINKRYVLTAGHCLKNTGVQKLQKVILGEYDKSQNTDCNIERDAEGEELKRSCLEPIEEFGIETVKVHPEHSLRSHRNDIGLIRLDQDVTMKAHIQAVCLPVTSALSDQHYENYVVSSWKSKYSEIPTGSEVLHRAILQHMNNTICNQKIARLSPNTEVNEQQICTEASSVICRGSAGAPLGNTARLNGGDRFVQFGINSFGSSRCGDAGVPEVYTRVASYMDWILSAIVP